MKLSLRRACPADAAAIARIAETCFGDAFDSQRIRRLLEAGNRDCVVARDDGGVLAFADHFITVSGRNQRRLELDLLAVAPRVQGQGLGRRLLEKSVSLAQQRDVAALRALVRSDNLAMRRLCCSAGLKPSELEFNLYVAAPAAQSRQPLEVGAAHLIAVETFAYSGLWLEGAITRAAIGWALSTAHSRGMQTVGALLAQGEGSAAALLVECGFQLLGSFNWWTLNLKND